MKRYPEGTQRHFTMLEPSVQIQCNESAPRIVCPQGSRRQSVTIISTRVYSPIHDGPIFCLWDRSRRQNNCGPLTDKTRQHYPIHVERTPYLNIIRTIWQASRIGFTGLVPTHTSLDPTCSKWESDTV